MDNGKLKIMKAFREMKKKNKSYKMDKRSENSEKQKEQNVSKKILENRKWKKSLKFLKN